MQSLFLLKELLFFHLSVFSHGIVRLTGAIRGSQGFNIDNQVGQGNQDKEDKVDTQHKPDYKSSLVVDDSLAC